MNCKYCQAELEADNSVCPVCGRDNADPEAQTPDAAPAEAEEAVTEEAVTEEAPAEETASIEEEAPIAEEAPAEEPSESEETPSGEASEQAASAEGAAEETAGAVAEPAAAPAAKPGLKGWKKAALITAAAVVCVALLCALVLAVYYGINGRLPFRSNDISYKDSYTVSDEAAINARDKVVATVGDRELTNGQLQIFYWMQTYNFIENNYYYLSSIGLDYTQPLDAQTAVDGEGTWQQYLLEGALQTWQKYRLLSDCAEENGLELDAALQESLAAVPENMEQTAMESGYESADEMLRSEMGPGCTMDDYVTYLELYYKGYQYFSAEYDKLSPTDEEIAAYFTEHAEQYAQSGVSQDGSRLVDVRHVLLQPEGGETDADGNTVYTDEAWEACRLEAQALLNDWVSGGATEEAFAQMAVDHSADSSAASGGLYTNVGEGYMVEEFNDWCFDDSRMSGDYGLVKTQFGYHLMYFVDGRETWYAYARSDLVSEKANQMLDELVAANPMKVNYRKIVLGDVDL